MDFVDTIDAEPSVDIAIEATQFAEVYDDEDVPEVQPSSQAAAVPEGVQVFLNSLNTAVSSREASQIFYLYENVFNRLTDKFYKNQPWPASELAQQITDRVFGLLYRELYFRHIYAKLQPTLEERFQSWQNYLDLFALFGSDGVSFELPDAWLWDMVDEFVYQFQSYCQYKHKLKAKTEEEMARILASPAVWSAPNVLSALYGLVERSNIRAILEREKSAVTDAEPVAVPEPAAMYKMLGYFAVVGLVRTHSLLGDYFSALQSLGPIDIGRKGLFTRVPACHISLFYYVGFAHLMTRRYVDAIRTFSNILLYISRTERYHSRSYQYDQMMKKNDQMFALLAVTLSLCPTRVDESLHTILREKYQDKVYRMQRGDDSAYEELFTYACPKFVVPAAPVFAETHAGQGTELYRLQLKLFMQEVKQQALIPTIRSFLRLYTSIDMKKMASFIDLDENAFRANLLCYKHKTSQWSGDQTGKGRAGYADLDFFIDNDVIHIVDTKTQRRYTEYFTQAIVELNRGQ